MIQCDAVMTHFLATRVAPHPYESKVCQYKTAATECLRSLVQFFVIYDLYKYKHSLTLQNEIYNLL